MESNKKYIENYLGKIYQSSFERQLSTDLKNGLCSYSEIKKLASSNKITITKIEYPIIIDSLSAGRLLPFSETAPLPYNQKGEPTVWFEFKYYELGFNGGENNIIFFFETIDLIRGLDKEENKKELPDRLKYYPATAEELFSFTEIIRRGKELKKPIRKKIAALGTIFTVESIKNKEKGYWFLIYNTNKNKFEFQSFSQHWTSPAKCSDFSFLSRLIKY